MQGQRGTIGSLPETLSFDHGSTSNSTVDQQICWNNMRNPAETRLPEYMLSPTGTNVTFMNPLSNERPALSSWSLGEPSSSGPQNEVAPRDERKTELGWAALNPYGAPASRSEEPQRERTNSLHVDSSNLNFVQSSNSNMMPTSINLNAGYASHDGNIGCSNAFKSGAAESQVIPPGSSSESLHLPSGSGGYLVEESDSRLGCPYEGRRASSKRKALEQSSLDANCSYFQHGESNLWPNGSVCYDGGNSLSISTPSEQRNSGLVLGVRETTTERIPNLYAAGNAESSRRNLRVRINPSSQQESVPPTLSGVARHPNGLSTHLSSRLLPNEQPLDSRSAPTVDNPASLSQPVVMQVPTLPRNAQPFRWERGSSSRNGSSSNTNFPRDRDAFSREETSVFPREETRSRSSMARQLLENPLFTQDLRNVVRSSTSRSLAGGNVSVPGNVASSSRTGSSSGVTRSSAPSWASHPNVPSHYPRRFSEFVRRSLISSLGSESGGQSSNPTQLHAPSPEEIMLMSGTANQGHHQHHSYPRPSSWLERQGDGVIGFPHPLRTLASGEGRSRLVVSEVCS